MEAVEKRTYQELRDVGAKLKKLRIAKGYKSYETFAFEHSLPRMQYWRMESGTANFTLKSLIRVLAVHDMSLREFFNKG